MLELGWAPNAKLASWHGETETPRRGGRVNTDANWRDAATGQGVPGATRSLKRRGGLSQRAVRGSMALPAP